jgi:hypothetical protein
MALLICSFTNLRNNYDVDADVVESVAVTGTFSTDSSDALFALAASIAL